MTSDGYKTNDSLFSVHLKAKKQMRWLMVWLNGETIRISASSEFRIHRIFDSPKFTLAVSKFFRRSYQIHIEWSVFISHIISSIVAVIVGIVIIKKQCNLLISVSLFQTFNDSLQYLVNSVKVPWPENPSLKTRSVEVTRYTYHADMIIWLTTKTKLKPGVHLSNVFTRNQVENFSRKVKRVCGLATTVANPTIICRNHTTDTIPA